jgi:putative membrane protein
MKAFLPALAAVLFAGAALAQSAPSGGPDAKGNAPIKHVHTINDGSAKPGANSFTQNQARKHILHAGYQSVSGLTKGPDGVWRGVATKDGASKNVALDFKGNISEGGASPQ